MPLRFMYHDGMTEDGLCKHGDGKPVHGKKDECQAHYRQTMRRERGLQKPGPKPDPTKPYSRHGGKLTHHGKRPACASGHDFVEGSHRLSITGKRICLVCEQARTHCHRGHEWTAESTYLWQGIKHCRVCRAEDAPWRHRLYKYKITYDDFIEMLDEQDYACKCCGDPLDLATWYAFAVDHDHSCCPGEYTCGKCLRGITCGACNKMLGFARDDIDRLQSAINYLAQYEKAGVP